MMKVSEWIETRYPTNYLFDDYTLKWKELKEKMQELGLISSSADAETGGSKAPLPSATGGSGGELCGDTSRGSPVVGKQGRTPLLTPKPDEKGKEKEVINMGLRERMKRALGYHPDARKADRHDWLFIVGVVIQLASLAASWHYMSPASIGPLALGLGVMLWTFTAVRDKHHMEKLGRT